MFNVGSVQGYLKLNTSGWTGAMSSAQMSLASLSRTFTRTGAVAVGSIALITREFGKFDKAIRHATSVSETTEEQFKAMSDMALDASVKWNKAATDTAQAFYFLGSAGLTVTEQMQAFMDTISTVDNGNLNEAYDKIQKLVALDGRTVTIYVDEQTTTGGAPMQQSTDILAELR